ncbi:Transcriptional regulatory protein ZraR [Fundidesulfovibrio magnetotacticus]|uniref:Transcriptional regulatory protein ZraR n=1 Tax=Fundidesulfovibrio magnetotacticus TaxID=2730080 RepID=A0A6V8LWC6_9BACT|nr:sigma-54 dependent transcriptional regulator [Fundidesulfovibrio magnetotacticus]GFK95200.1 Transcriptional regulatory protein ZraR [Fundidesulfovibrio magnetotacticus]
MGSVLIIDDDLPIREALSRVVESLGLNAEESPSLREGLRKARSGNYDVVLLDVRLPDGNGLDAIGELQSAQSRPEVIVITGWGDPDGAEAAMRRGAWDYIEKPPTLKAMTGPLLSAMAYRGSRPRSSLGGFAWDGAAGQHPGRMACLEQAARAARSEAAVLITGETGTGKELFARAIHANSRRATGPFVPVDCAALPSTLAESLLFGSERGAYTGADRPREGLILQAHGGTLFLDEVGELPLDVQKTFLRTLQERKVRPVGGPVERPCDFRLLAATHRDLDAMAEAGEFREDLLFRLRGMVIALPPVREQPGDVLTFAAHFLDQACARHGAAPKRISPAAEAALTAYSWPGNIREIQNVVEGMVALGLEEPELHPVHLPVHLRIQVARGQMRDREIQLQAPSAAHSPPPPPETDLPSTPPTLKVYRQAMDRLYLERLLDESGANPREACRISGLSRSRLYALLKEHGLRLSG